jgi:hypothetical protein
MQSNPQRYVELMVYKLVHYLTMAARMYVTHIKLKWIVNDIGNVYLQEVMEFATSEVPRRIVRFKLTHMEEAPDFYSNENNNFVEVYRDMKRRRALNTLIIKKDVDGRNYEELLDLMNPEMKREFDDRKERRQEERTEKGAERGRKKSRIDPGLYKTLDIPRREAFDRVVPKRVKPTNASTYE